MVSPSTFCTSCLRAARRAVPRSSSSSSSSRSSTIPSTFARPYTHRATTPLYLDFLLPSSSSARTSLLQKTTRYATPAYRTLATSTATTSTTTTSTSNPPPTDPSAPIPARAILNPRTDDNGKPMSLSISPRASHRLHSIALKDSAPGTALRVSIESGGCHGFQYLMSLTDLQREPAGKEDTVFEGVRGEKVVVDESSLELLSGSTVDYTMELIGSQFTVTGIPGATSSCGCGTSFDIKLD